MNAPSGLCDGCQTQFFAQRHHRCRRCAIPLSLNVANDHECGDCLRQPPAFDATIAAVDYAAPADRMVLGLKFAARLELAPICAAMMRDALLTRSDMTLPNFLCAVPLGQQRLAERGFNQALEVARPLSRSLGIRLIPELAFRQRDTHAQARLDPAERQKNVHDAFCLSAKTIDLVRSAHIGIVDDVMTTGQTMHELAVTLKRFGAARVTGIVFARTPQQ
ncbi:ComF family protein [Noviherbaspirillum saxi]